MPELKKALVIAPQPFFSFRGTPFSVYYRTAVMAEHGVQIDFLTYGEGKDVDIPGVRIIRIPRFRILGNVKVGPSFLKMFLDVFIMIYAVGLLSRNRYDFVHAHEEAVFLCHYLKKINGFKLIYDMHSSLPQQLTNFNFTKSKFLIKVFEKLENDSICASDAIITICPDLYDHVQRIIGENRRHILIENSIFDPVRICGSDGRGTGSENAEPALHELPEMGKWVVYAGTLEPYQGIDLLIDAFRIVAGREHDARLLIAGGTRNQVERYREKVLKKDLERNVFLTGLVPQTISRQFLQKASVIVSPRIQGTNTPLKIYEYLASGVPIVATEIHSHTQVLDRDVAFLVKPDADSLAGGIRAALNDMERRKFVSRNAVNRYEEKYSRRVYEEKIRRLLEILT